jgi:hypothetical protein
VAATVAELPGRPRDDLAVLALRVAPPGT